MKFLLVWIEADSITGRAGETGGGALHFNGCSQELSQREKHRL